MRNTQETSHLGTLLLHYLPYFQTEMTSICSFETIITGSIYACLERRFDRDIIMSRNFSSRHLSDNGSESPN